MNALEIKNLKKVYPQFVLDNISFHVKEGHIVGFIGRNGAGKSTTIKGILQLISTEGSISVFHEDMRQAESKIKQQIGYVGGGFRYYPLKPLSAIRKAFSKFYPAWDQNKYETYLQQFGLTESKKVQELSEGMKVKFALALALSHGAKLLIMDEPTSGLDPLSREDFCDIVLNLVRREKVSVLFSTHITSDLMRIADDIIYISNGKILVESPLQELLSKYDLIQFDRPEQVRNINIIGAKAVKNGYEGIVLKSDQIPEGIQTEAATIDQIMIHLENTQKEVHAC